MVMNSPTQLRLIQFKAGYNLPVHAAVEMGVFSKNGVEVEISYTPGSVHLMEAMKAGEFEIGHIAADDLIAEVEGLTSGKPGGSDLFLFMGLHSGLLALVGSPDICAVESLWGKAIAVDARSTGFVFVLERLLRSKGLGPEDYKLVEVGGFESRFAALMKGKYAATLLTEPFIGNALDTGFNLLARGGVISPVYQGTGGVANRTWAKENTDTLVRYIRSYVEATRWCFNLKNRKDCLDLLSKHNGIKGKSAARTLDTLLDPQDGLYPEADLNLPGLTAALELRADMGFLRRPVPPVEKYLDLSFHRKAVSFD